MKKWLIGCILLLTLTLLFSMATAEDSCEHTPTKIASDQYRVPNGLGDDCRSAKTYYYACSKCGEIVRSDYSVQTWTGPAGPHQYTRKVASSTYQVPGSGTDCQEHKSYYMLCCYCLDVSDTLTWESDSCGPHIYEEHQARLPTCTEDGWTFYKVCTRCGDTTDHQSLPMTNHAYTAVVTAPTCYEKGYTTYTCYNCADTYVADPTPALAHWFGEWAPAEDGTHTSRCLRGCRYTKAVTCAQFPFAIGETELSICPVCGLVSDGVLLPVLEGVKASAKSQTGELTVHMGTLAGGGSVLCVVYEFAGQVVAFTGEVELALPQGVSVGGASCVTLSFSPEAPAAVLTVDTAQ